MMLYTVYLSIRNGLELAHRPEIEDPAEVIFLLQALYICICRVMQMRGAKQSM